MADLSPQDLDMITRTVIGEAGQEPNIGKAAVAHVILNRMKQKNAPDAASVILAPKQFTTWQDRPRELQAISPKSKAYQDAYNIVHNVVDGDIPDPTNGALNYANVDQVQRSGNTSAMKWINGMSNVNKIGSHTFGNADGVPVASNDFDTDKQFLESFGKKSVATPEASSNFDDDKKFLQSFTSKSAAPAAVTPSDSSIPVPEANMTPEQKADFNASLQKGADESQKSALQRFREALDPVSAVSSAASSVFDKAKQSWNSIGNGVSSPNIAPTFETFPSKVTTIAGNEEPATGLRMKDPGKVLGVLGGLAGVATSPISAAESGIESLTGNKDFAEKLTDLVPVPKLLRGVNEARPAVKAVRSVEDLLPPEALENATRNPTLAPVDVSDQARKRADMIATDALAPRAQKAVLDFVDQRKGELKGDVQSAVETLGELPTPFDVVKQIQQRARDTGAKVINPVVENAEPVPIKPLLKQIDRMIGSPEAIAGETPRIPLTPTQVRLLNLRRDITTGEMAPLNERAGLSVGPINDALKQSQAAADAGTKAGYMGKDRTADFIEARRLLNSARRGYTSEDDLVAGLKDLAKKQNIVGPIDDALKMIQKGPEEFRGADFLHGVQSRLREEATALSKSSTGSDRLMSGDLFDARDKIVGAIDKASSGEYRPALAQYRTDKEVADAFDKGLNISQMPGKTSESILEHSGESWKDWAKESSTHPDELASARLGALSWMAHEIEGVRAGKKLLETPKNPVLQAKLGALFGKDKSEQYLNLLEDTNNKAKSAQIGNNSATFQRMREAEASPIRVPGQNKSSQATLQSIFPIAAGIAAESIPQLAAFHGIPSMIGLGAAAARGGYAVAKHVVQHHQYKSDLARRLAEARRLTTPFSQQPDLLQLMRARRELPSPSYKLQDLLSPAFLSAPTP